MDVQNLIDKAEILECMHRYCRGIDRLDRAMVRSAYHDDAIDDHIGYSGPFEGFLDWAFEYHGSDASYDRPLHVS